MIAIAHETNNVKFQFHKFITGNDVRINQKIIQTTNHNRYDHLNQFFKDFINIITEEMTNPKKKAQT